MLSFREQILAQLAAPDSDSMTREFASWLLSDIDSDIWWMKFGKTKCVVRWRVKFGNSFLTSPEHAGLLRTFKYFLLLQTHQVCCRGQPAVGQVAYNSVTRALRQLDYMLLHDEQWMLSKHGFRAVGKNDIVRMLYAFEASSSDDVSVYEWSTRLSDYLVRRGQELTPIQMQTAESEMKELSVVELPESEWTLTLNSEQLTRGRAYLWLNGFYTVDKRTGYKHTPRTRALAGEIYSHTLWGMSPKSIHEELCLGRYEPYLREYEGVDVQTSVGGGASAQSFNEHKRTLLTLPLLSKFGCDIPDVAIREATTSWTSVPEKFRTPGRFRQPPFWQVMDTIRHSADFAYDHADHLISSYLNVVNAARAAKQSVTSFVIKNDVRNFLEPDTLRMGASVWALKTRIALPKGYPVYNTAGKNRVTAAEFFPRLRGNEGVIDLLQVLCGAIQHNTGALTARRQDELRLLPASGSLGLLRDYVIFPNAKTGYGGKRATEARPIPSLVSDQVAMLERLHREMGVEGGADSFLFSIPGGRGAMVHHISGYNSALDTLCDYFETPLTADNKRYYIRQHQLRKFFVISFFYGSKNSNLESLRWFLGHADAEYLWHYITAQISGDMLREVQATFLVDELTGRSSGAEKSPAMEISQSDREALAALVLERFGTSDFTLVESAALDDYMKFLLTRGVEVEPIFFATPEGHEYVMGVSIAKGRLR